MPGAFKTVKDMLRAFVHNYKPRSTQPKHGEVQEPDLILITFTPDEIQQIKQETGLRIGTNAVNYLISELNEELRLDKGFRITVYTTEPESTNITLGLLYCPDSMEFPPDDEELQTGPTMNEQLESVSHTIPSSV